MPLNRSPDVLYQLGKKRLNNLLENFLLSLKDRLFLDEDYERIFWEEELTKTYDEIRYMRAYILESPVQLLQDCIRDILPNYLKQLETYLSHPLMDHSSAAEIRRGICKELLKCVFLPCIETCNLETVTSLSLLQIVYESLNEMNHLKALILPILSPHDLDFLESTLLQQIGVFTLLQKFEYETNCTDQILLSLGTHCRNLKVLIVSGSLQVTENSLTTIINMRNLIILNVLDTNIDPYCYALILCELPNIGNITDFFLLDTILASIPANHLNTVTQFNGWLNIPGTLTSKCRYLRQVAMQHMHKDLRCLADLHHLEVLSLEWSDYMVCRLEELFEVIGAQRLKKLSLGRVNSINMFGMLSKLRSVEVLELLYCNFLLPLNIVIRPIAHFRTLKILSICSFSIDFFKNNLQSYVNLQEFYLTDSFNLRDEFIHNTLNAGGLKKIRKFHIAHSSELTMAAVVRLIDTCEHLIEIGDLGLWDNVQYEAVRILRNIIKENNYNLEIVYSKTE